MICIFLQHITDVFKSGRVLCRKKCFYGEVIRVKEEVMYTEEESWLIGNKDKQ